jgi:hypothetical protein
MKPAKATLIKRKTDDGLIEIHDHIQLGKEYLVDLDSRSMQKGYNLVEGKAWEKEGILVISSGGRWLPTELLRIEEKL